MSTLSGTGSSTMTDQPLKQPFGDASGGLVNVRSLTVAQVVAQLDASDFASLFGAEGGNSIVSGSGNYTVYVPTNGAFERQIPGTITSMSSAEKKRFVEYHIVKNNAIDTDAEMAGNVQTASGDLLNINFGVDQIPLVGSAIVITQYNCKNGVVYTINNVLLPPQK